MKYPQVWMLLCVALAAATPAWAQYGLYGSPDMLQLSSSSAAAPQYTYPGAPTQPSYAPGLEYFDAAAAPSQAPSRYAYAPPQGPRYTLAANQAALLEPVAPQGPSVVNQMLEESGYPCTPGSNAYGGYCASDACGGTLSCGTAGCCSPLWYGRANWLIMSRDKPNTLWTTYEAGNNPNQLPTEIGVQWGNGGQITLGRSICCGCWALEATYWGLSSLEGQVSVTHPSGVSTPLDFTDVVFANPALPGLPVDLFDGADEHRVSRSDDIHDVELNMIYTGGSGCHPCSRHLDINWLWGVRYFRFQERWAFHSLQNLGSWANPADIGCLEDNITNNLVGAQFGFNLEYGCHKDVTLFARPRFGIYDNNIKHTFLAHRGDGENFAPDPLSGVPGSYPVHSTTNSLSFLTELDVGVDWQVTPKWSAFAGYRVIAATGIGLADNQIPPYIVDIPEIAAIDRNGQLILHGAFAGVSYKF